MMKFQDMPYERPDIEKVKQELLDLNKAMFDARSSQDAEQIFLAKDRLEKHVMTMNQLAQIRQDINTNDEFYVNEVKFWNKALPELEEVLAKFNETLVFSLFRVGLSKKYGSIVFENAELDMKAFAPELVEDMQRENDLTHRYENLLASAQIPFEGGIYTLSQMTPFKNDFDDDRRLRAWKAEGQWYKDHQAEMDEIYDELVHLRDGMGRKLHYDGYTELGYYRMHRNCWTKEDIARFREGVQKYVVPVAEQIYRRQAERLGKSYPMSFADNQLEFRSGNPKPAGDADAVLAAAQKFYDELSPETSEFFHTMMEGGLMDVLSREGKRGGGYCTGLYDYEVPFIFANFNGTKGDVEVMTHEAGHAFEAWVNRSRKPVSTIFPTMDGAEVHSMSMEFFGELWAEDFFGKDARKFLYSHLASALTFIPYGTMVDHFQHEVYARPDMTPAERHAVWKELMGIYMPWERLDGEIPFYAEGQHWQLKHHIYSLPFYYIDYCLAQTVALEFWAMIQDDKDYAWERYMAYTSLGGSDTFVAMLDKARLESPFYPDTLKTICGKAAKYLEAFDLTGIE
ncbi:MAG: M3 family oligoendopeptidase [Solobacterium sp.]|nr:M3 family oligoendopeptidase [Solobacterium sp.]